MSKRLKEIFAKIRYVSFLETIEDSPCQDMGSLDIIVEEQLADGRAWMHEASRYVKFYHSEDKFTQYEVRIDKTCGIGRLHFDDIFEYPYMIEEVEESMQQQNTYTVQYYVNGREVKDVAMCLQDPAKHYEVRIVNQQIARADVELYASLRNRQQDVCSFQEGEEFNVFIGNDSFEKNVVLHAGNGFREVLYNIPIATYSIEEQSKEYTIRYRFQCGEEKREGVGMLCAGHNEIEIIHEVCKKSSIIIEKYVRQNGQLCKPTTDKEYRVRIISDDMDCVITLCEENGFCVCLEDVRPGYYDVCEIDGYDKVSYSVNGQYEVNFASVLVHRGEDANVMIIQDPSQTICHAYQDSPLRICKYIRRFDGSITKPQADAQFMVSLRGCGICETFYLNVHNNFCVDIADLCYGEYEVCEVACDAYTTSYIVNDGREKTTACICINNTDSYCVSILNEQRNKGCLNIQQYMRNEYGELIKPQRDECFQVVLSSYFFKKCITLDMNNDWSVCVRELRFGSYEIREENQEGYDVAYQIDCERATHRARFVIDDGKEHEVKIINNQKQEDSGVLKICKFEETNAHELVKPACDEEFEVVVQGEGFHEVYCLCANNNWCVMLEGLNKGDYEVCEIETYHYDVRYQVNHEPVDQVLLCMGEENQEVSIINKRKTSGILKLYATIRTCDGRLLRPKRSESFEILVEGNQDSFSVCLNEQNDWCVLLDSLREEVYRIIQRDNLGYRVSYCLEGKEVSFAKVKLGRMDVEVGIINQEKGCSGMVHIAQYIEDEEGNIGLPAQGEEYRFILDGRCFSRTYTLRESNDFSVCFDDLDEGSYEIKALESTTRYCVNGKDVDKATFQLMDQDIRVEMIHTFVTHGEVCIKKCIKRNHTLELPDVDSSYRILLKGKHTHEIYTLHAGNEFCVCLCGLKNQHYEIIELDAPKPIFEINEEVQEEGYFLYDGENIQVRIINEEVLYGNMEIVKKIEDEQGNLVHPNRCESFVVSIESEDYQKCITLNHDNDFCVRLYDLAQGHYEIKEVHPCGSTSYLINDIPASRAVVDVSDLDTCITIISHTTIRGCIQLLASVMIDGKPSSPNMDEEFKVCIASENMHKEVRLTKSNEFCEQLVDLAPDTYTITECQAQDIRFSIDDQEFKDVVCVALHGEFVCVHVIRYKQTKADMKIYARIQDATGSLIKPHCEDTLGVILLHNGCKQMFELNCENVWERRFCDQNKGEYEVKVDEKEYDVKYQIQGESQAGGRFTLDQEHIEVIVILTRKCKRRIHLQSVVEDDEGHRLSLQEDMQFKLMIQGAKNKEECILQSSNQWSTWIEVERGMYTIQQQDPLFQEHYYLVNDQKECTIALNIQDQDVYIQVVNVRVCDTGTLQIATYKRAQNCDCYRRPKETDEYDIEVTSSNYHKSIKLHAYNHWKEKLENLAYGTYTIKELQANAKTRYIMNGKEEEEVGVIQICEGEHSVTIINEEEVQYKGSMELCKLLKDEEGTYRYPEEKDSFWVMIKGENSSNRILLNSANHFYASIRNLAQGWYEVSEESDTQGLMYVVNNGAPVQRGFVQVKQNANTLNIIESSIKHKGSMTICKYIQGENGICTKPLEERYTVHVSKPGFNKTIELNKENSYCIVLDSLEDGAYVVDEIAQEGMYYIIDKGTCVDHAIVNVVQDDHQIEIINTQTLPQKGSISLMKYIRIGEQLLRPKEEDSFVFHLEKENFHKCFILDKTNQFMYTINNLEDGEYQLSETTTGDALSYIINGQMETTFGTIDVHANRNTVQIINTKGMPKGSMLLQKRMRVNQEYVNPPQDFSTMIHITKEGYDKIVPLDRHNQWTCCLRELAYGTYSINEMDTAYHVSYIVNGNPSEEGIVQVDEQANVVEIINEQKQDMGSICIEKFIRMDNQLVRPQDNFIARVHISKPGYNQVYELNKANNWNICVKGLENGYYVLDEVDNDDYVSYIINGESEVVNGIVFVNSNDNTVQMINAMQAQSGSIIVSKQLRNDMGASIEPLPEQTFEIVIRRGSYEAKIALNKENNWVNQVTGLMNGSYQVEELTTMYRVSYKVDDGVEELYAPSVNVQGQEHRVQVINSPLTNTGRLEITKFIKRSNGTLIRPADGDVFRISIIGNKKERVVELNAGNMFRIVIHDLDVGEYEIKETYANENYFATYRVNGGEEADIAVVQMKRGINNQVMVINELIENLNSVDVFKYMLDEDGNYFSPPADLRVQFRMIGAAIDEVYDLNVANSWHQSFKSLPNGEYQIMEIGSSYMVKYIVNYGNPQEEARFLAQPGVSNIIGIINLQGNVQQGKLTLIKQVRNQAGDRITPDVESFVFRVTSAQFDRLVNLNKDDAYTQVLENLPFGTYTVVEQDATYQVSFQVNGQNETSQGRIEIKDGADNEMIIINTQTEVVYDVSDHNKIKVVIE